MSNTTPPGWHPDPQVPGQQRYWDGSSWTDRTAPGGPGPDQPSAQAPIGAPDEPAKKKNWFMRHKILSGLLALILIIVVASALGGGGDDEDPVATDDNDSNSSETAKSPDEPTADKSKSEKPEAEPEPEPEPESYGDGTYEVGKDIPVGTYRSSEDTDLCYWAMLNGFSGELDDVIRNGNNSPAIVNLDKATPAFESQGCGDWIEVSETFPEKPATSFEDGAFIVGEHIAPGRYRADGGSDLCYWARVSNFSGDQISSIIANGNNATIVEIAPSDRGFEAYGCGKWTKS